MRSIVKLAALAGIGAALLSTGCPKDPDPGTDAGTDSGTTGGPPESKDMRITELNIQTPTTLGIVNGILATSIADDSINILLKNRMLTGAATVEVGDGEASMTAGTYIFPSCDAAGMCTDGLTMCATDADCGTSMFTATLDQMTRNLATTSPQTVTISVGVDSDGDMVDDIVIGLDLVNAAFDVFFDTTYDNIVDPDAPTTISLLTGALTVEDACAINVDLGGGTMLNVLDILDGSGMGTNPPNLTPGMCAAGDGASNIQPDTDSDGDMTNDAYAVSANVAAETVIIVDM